MPAKMPRLPRLLAPLFLAVLLVGPSLAADKDKGPAFTDPPKGDWNFQLMGEFVGEITPEDGESELLGLQIRSIGGDQFDARSFIGGVPGQEKHEPKAIQMIGQRSEDFVVLSGGPWVIIVEKDHCLLLDRKGTNIGKLERLERKSPTLGARPPEDAMVLFDGTNIDQFADAQMTKDGLLMEGATIKPMFQDFNLHVEFRLPYMPQADGQSRGNSGLYLLGRYECQVLDSFALDPLYNGLGALYRFRAPDLNMALPPLAWQTYDVQFTSPRWAADGSKIRNAHITSWVNGVKVQDNVELPNKTGAGKQEEPNLQPILLQNHGDPVRYRNIWVVDRGLAAGDFPVQPTKEQLEEDAKAEQAKRDEAKAKAKKRQADAKRKAEQKKAAAKQAEEKVAVEKAEAMKAADAAKEDAKKSDDAKPAASSESGADKPGRDKPGADKAGAPSDSAKPASDAVPSEASQDTADDKKPSQPETAADSSK
ncbi:MAG: 3-keto-disaccharide hydrolase [Rubripirellula sp.]